MKRCYILISGCLEEMKFLHLSALWNSLWSLPGEHQIGHKPPTLSSSEEMRDLEWLSYITTIVVWWAVVCHSSSMKCGKVTMGHVTAWGKVNRALLYANRMLLDFLCALIQWTFIARWSSSEGNCPQSCLIIWKVLPWLYLQHVMMLLWGTHLSSA